MLFRTRLILNVICGVVFIGLVLLLIWGTIETHNLGKSIYLAEFNAQMEKYECYNTHITVLNQFNIIHQHDLQLFGLVFGWMAIIFGAIVQIVLIFVEDFEHWYDSILESSILKDKKKRRKESKQ